MLKKEIKPKLLTNNNKAQSFDELFLEYHPLLYRYGNKLSSNSYLIEECIQELFIYIYEQEIVLSTIRHTKAYLFTSFRRRLLKKIKATKTPISDLPSDLQFSPEDFIIQQEAFQQQEQWIHTILNKLPWRQREVLYLRFFNNLSAKEIAEVMGIQRQVVSNVVYKALKKLRKENRQELKIKN